MRTVFEGKTGRCEIRVGEPLASAASLAAGSRCVVVTDATVRRLHGQAFAHLPTFELGQGEGEKTLASVERLYGFFLDQQLDRDGFVLAVGGGIVCDVAGFAAATWLRGVPCGYAPTTLLAQADAGVGGKTGVNLRGLKNLVGSFSQPRFCLCDPVVLGTLPERELRCGLAEVVKAALLGDPALLDFLERQRPRVLAREPAALERIVASALAVKLSLVAADELERGERRKLNLGHTLGHALEAALGWPHGEAVAAGIAAAARLSVRGGLLAESDALRIEQLLTGYGLPTRAEVSPEVLAALSADKKRSGSRVREVLLEAPGRARLVELELEELRRDLASLA